MLDPTERKVLAASAFVAGCLLLLPRQWASAGIAFALFIGLLAWHLARSKKETGAAPPAAPPPAAEAVVAGVADDAPAPEEPPAAAAGG
jgi:membrane protein implicated in regulation of membrane protease activity